MSNIGLEVTSETITSYLFTPCHLKRVCGSSADLCPLCPTGPASSANPEECVMEKMKRFKRRLSLTLRSSHTIDESLSELAEQMTIEDGGNKDNGQ